MEGRIGKWKKLPRLWNWIVVSYDQYVYWLLSCGWLIVIINCDGYDSTFVGQDDADVAEGARKIFDGCTTWDHNWIAPHFRLLPAAVAPLSPAIPLNIIKSTPWAWAAHTAKTFHIHYWSNIINRMNENSANQRRTFILVWQIGSNLTCSTGLAISIHFSSFTREKRESGN